MTNIYVDSLRKEETYDKIKNERGEIAMETTEIWRVIWEYYVQNGISKHPALNIWTFKCQI